MQALTSTDHRLYRVRFIFQEYRGKSERARKAFVEITSYEIHVRYTHFPSAYSCILLPRES